MRRIDRNMLIIKVVALVLFAGVCAFLWWDELTIRRPRAQCLQTPGAEWNEDARSCRVPPSYACEQSGGWWEPRSKTCAKVIYIPNITGRPPGQAKGG
jgi:hypothetical protein